MAESSPYVPPTSVAIACWAVGVVIAVFGLWFWLGTPTVPWYETYLSRPNMWLLVGVGGGMTFGFPIYGILTLRGRLRQLY
ncbi:MAG TPA: hypothetical protein VK660_05610 [Xanthomonadaceae bacterium]|nr:hypothetical protein [Xanthomonadaceae bacterium]